MPNRSLTLVLLAASASLTQAQVFKCPDANGRTVIQQMPCPGGKQMDVKPASGQAKPRPAALDADGKPMTEAERIEANTQASMRHRRMQDLSERIVPSAWSEIQNHRSQCQAKLERLRAGQYAYRQNLYGKTHAAQIASEMAAESAQCDTKDRELVRNYQSLVAECKGLSACKDAATP
ncbi:DUF4124 domain-containing protein [Ottowia sp.]|uniref:DUF4124 domain-containing protein n=1 Tax=Ottowia sp. TaxID=1898956 RepID=UPI00261783C6|nr:DUF4124 domain-containing protein [Ottowia sp.]